MARNSAYFASLVNLPTVILEPGTYVTRRGDFVSVSAVSSRHDFGCTGQYHDGANEAWHRSGRIFASRESANDIVSAA